MSLLNFVSMGCYLLTAAIFFCDAVTAADVAIPVLYVAVVLISLWHPHIYFTHGMAIIATLLMVLGLLIQPPPTGSLWVVIFNDLIALVAIWTTALVTIERKKLSALRLQALRERDEAKEEIKTLSSLLPMCAWCKKIRDDKGEWDQIDTYVAKITHSSITHGMCPDCSQRMNDEAAAMSCAPVK